MAIKTYSVCVRRRRCKCQQEHHRERWLKKQTPEHSVSPERSDAWARPGAEEDSHRQKSIQFPIQECGIYQRESSCTQVTLETIVNKFFAKNMVDCWLSTCLGRLVLAIRMSRASHPKIGEDQIEYVPLGVWLCNVGRRIHLVRVFKEKIIQTVGAERSDKRISLIRPRMASWALRTIGIIHKYQRTYTVSRFVLLPQEDTPRHYWKQHIIIPSTETSRIYRRESTSEVIPRSSDHPPHAHPSQKN